MQSLFTLPPQEALTIEAVNQFCSLNINEATRVEYKRDFPSHLEKSISAFANTFGGLIILGVECDAANRPVMPIAGLADNSQMEERIIQICNRIFPPVWPTVWIVKLPGDSNMTTTRRVVVIRVDESEAAPHAINGKEDVYLRTGNVSQPFRRANLDDISEQLTGRRVAIERRKDLKNRFGERANFFYGEYVAEKTAKVSTPSLKRVGSDRMAKSVVWNLTSIPLFPRTHLATLAELTRVIQACPPTRFTDHGINSLIGGDIRSAQESLLTYSGGSFFQIFEVSQHGLIAYGENSIQDAQEMDEWIASPSSEAPTSSTLNPAYVRHALIGILIALPKIYSKLGFWGTLQISLRVMNVQGYRLRDTYGVQTSHACPDIEISLTRNLKVDELRENLDAIFCDFVHGFHSAFGWDDDIGEFLRREVSKIRDRNGPLFAT